MSTATATAATPAAPKPGNKKKLIVIVGAALLVVAAGGGGALFFLKKNAAAEDGGDGEATHEVAKHDPKTAPTFVPLEPFTVNLADRDAERYAQVGVTFGVADSKVADSIKQFMPAIRNNILLVLAHKTAAELLSPDGKDKLAQEIRRETARALGYEVDDEADDAAADRPGKKKRSRRAAPALPVQDVYFSNFIVQ